MCGGESVEQVVVMCAGASPLQSQRPAAGWQSTGARSACWPNRSPRSCIQFQRRELPTQCCSLTAQLHRVSRSARPAVRRLIPGFEESVGSFENWNLGRSVDTSQKRGACHLGGRAAAEALCPC